MDVKRPVRRQLYKVLKFQCESKKKKKTKCQRIKIAYFLIFLVDSLIFFKIKVCSLGHLNGCGC